MKIYLVGGAVRDKLLGLEIKERDWVVVGETPQAMLEKGFIKVGKDFPVFLHPETHEEYALARTERKVGRGYYGFECYSSPDITLEQDLSRRDITINAMAETEDGDLIDPFHGKDDLDKRILQHVSAAFSEDPVRLLRIARFKAKLGRCGFEIAPETKELMRSMVMTGEIDTLVPERVWQEIQKSLQTDYPTYFFEVLRECGALARLWPDLHALWGVPQPAEHHPEIDTGIHTMMTLDMAVKLSPDPLVRFAALCHDLGKGKTPTAELPSHRGHEERGVPCIQTFADHFHIPTEYKELAILVSRYHLHCHRAFELRSDTIVKLLENTDAFRRLERFEKFLLACEADAKGRKGREKNEYPQAARLRSAYDAAKNIAIQPFIDAGLEKDKLGKRIYQARVTAVSHVLKN
jgi:tRNA nucleotidyltransferase (CCA-adding enzyme)